MASFAAAFRYSPAAYWGEGGVLWGVRIEVWGTQPCSRLPACILIVQPASAQIAINVASGAELVSALTTVSSNPGNSYRINFTQSITLDSGTTLPAINTSSALTISGNNKTLDGGGVQRGFLVYRGPVAISDLAITNARAVGGNGGEGESGGGGGMGAGGALFVASGGSVSVSNVQLNANSAKGGNGGDTYALLGSGGGGGLEGNGGSGASTTVGSGAGGGGVGIGATGGDVASGSPARPASSSGPREAVPPEAVQPAGRTAAAAAPATWRETLAAQVRLGWSHEYASVNRPVTATFTGAPTIPFHHLRRHAATQRCAARAFRRYRGGREHPSLPALRREYGRARQRAHNDHRHARHLARATPAQATAGCGRSELPHRGA